MIALLFGCFLTAEIKKSNTTKKFIVYPDFQGVDPANISGQNKIINVKDALGNEPNKDYNYSSRKKKINNSNFLNHSRDGYIS